LDLPKAICRKLPQLAVQRPWTLLCLHRQLPDGSSLIGGGLLSFIETDFFLAIDYGEKAKV
jgi:hypothetical protein